MKNYRVAILGGGIAGLGVADACARAGLATTLFEGRSVAHATSNNTLRIIHGGFRYLQQLNIARVIRSLNDQSYVARSFPDAVHPLPCLMPLASTGLKSRWPVTAAALTYGSIMRACRSPLPLPRVISAQDVHTVAPQVISLAPRGALCWYDVVMTDPGYIHSTMTGKLRSNGVEINEHSAVVAISRTPRGFRILTTDGIEIEAAVVINTLGAWLGSVAIPEEVRGPRPKWCLGFNLVVSKQLHPTHACAVQSLDGRLFFCVPRGPHTAIGTWYVPYSAINSPGGIDSKPTVPEAAIDDFISSFNRSFQAFPIARADICEIDAGVLPMKSTGRGGPELYGSEIITARQGYCEVLSTKYTTFRSQGQRALHSVQRYT